MIVVWRPAASRDRESIFDYIAQDNPHAALDLDEEFEAKAAQLAEHPKLYRPGRIKGTREMVVRPNYIVVYALAGDQVQILRVLHAAQQWPPNR